MNKIPPFSLAALLLLAACDMLSGSPPVGGGSAPQPTPSSGSAPSSSASVTQTQVASFRPRTEVVASEMLVPWAMAFATSLPPGTRLPEAASYIFVTERPGRLRLIVDGELLAEPLAVFPDAGSNEGGLLGLDLDPHFDQNGHLYVVYTYRATTGLRNRVSRLTLRDTRAGAEKTLLEDIPAGSIHSGGRLKFGPGGKLYVTTGDTAQGDLAQRLDSLAGKILRLNSDGSIPDDNPFPGSPIYSYGHRNPQGLAWRPGTGQLFSTEHGPSAGVEGRLCCHDEINLIRPGGNYGWPVVNGIARDSRFVDPIVESGQQTWAPSGAIFYDGDLLSPWRGSLFFGTLRGQHLGRLDLDGSQGDRVVAQEALYQGAFGRIRDVGVGPDGALYFTTSNMDMRGPAGPDDDRLIRVVPGS